MAELGSLDARPPDPIRTERLVLREPERTVPALGYVFLPTAWGRGYAAEACGAVLAWSDVALPGEPLVLCTQAANLSSMRLAEKLGSSRWSASRSSMPSSASSCDGRKPRNPLWTRGSEPRPLSVVGA